MHVIQLSIVDKASGYTETFLIIMDNQPTQ